jgi:hypothetical protein
MALQDKEICLGKEKLGPTLRVHAVVAVLASEQALQATV